MHITIECLSGSLAGKVLSFEQPEISLGRGEHQKKDIDFADTDIGVSRNHALISVRDQHVYFVEQSRGGTLVRGQRIQGTTFELHPGDELQLGGPSGPRLRVRFRALTQIEPSRGQTEGSESQPPAQTAPVPPLPVQPSEPAILQPPAPPAHLASTLPPGFLEPGAEPLPPPRAKPTPIENSETLIQVPPPAPLPPRPAAHQETMLQPPAAPETVVQMPPLPVVPPLRQPDNTVVQLPANPPRPGARETNALRLDAPGEPQALSTDNTTYFQGPQQADYQKSAGNAGPPLPPGPMGSGQTFLQPPSSVDDSNPTLLQADEPLPWLPFLLIGLAALALLGVIWVFLLHQTIALFLPLPVVAVLAFVWFFFSRR